MSSRKAFFQALGTLPEFAVLLHASSLSLLSRPLNQLRNPLTHIRPLRHIMSTPMIKRPPSVLLTKMHQLDTSNILRVLSPINVHRRYLDLQILWERIEV